MSDVLFVSDMSGLSIWEIITWPINQVIKIAQWLFSGFKWPYDNRDMFGQPMIIKYAPKLTTCSFDNAGLTVALPTSGIPQLSASSQPGLTPFSLNMSCQNVGVNGNSDRAIEMFLSSTQLLSTDSSVLIDSSSSAAQGVGLRLINVRPANAGDLLYLNHQPWQRHDDFQRGGWRGAGRTFHPSDGGVLLRVGARPGEPG